MKNKSHSKKLIITCSVVLALMLLTISLHFYYSSERKITEVGNPEFFTTGIFDEIVTNCQTDGQNDPRLPAECVTISDELAPAIGRLRKGTGSSPSICTGWIAQGGILITAEHCDKDWSGGLVGAVFEFEVYDSQSDGKIVPSDPENQYVVTEILYRDAEDGTGYDNDEGEDWLIFKVANNTITGYQPIQAQLTYINFVRPDVSNSNIPTVRLIGYSRDALPYGSGCCGTNPNTRNYTLQTDDGPNLTTGSSPDKIRYNTFSSGGASGAPVIDEATGNAIGVHNSTSGGAYSGTSLHRDQFWTDFQSTQTSLTLSVYQKSEANSNISGSKIGHWMGSSFSESYVDGSSGATKLTIPTQVGNVEVLRGDQNVFNNPKEKFNLWANQEDVRNHQRFQMEPGVTQLTSQFQKTYSGISVKNYYPEYPSFTAGGQVAFKDPWLIDYADPDFDDETRNRGKNAVFVDHNSPFTPGFSAINGKLYNGLFLNENIPFDPDLNNYSVRHDDSPTTESFGGSLGNRQVAFYEWEGTGVNFEDPDEEETGVVFTSSSAEARANLKISDVSNENDAYTNNSQRRLIQTEADGNVWLHKVYSSLGHIWIEHSSNGGSTWTIGNGGQPLNTNSDGAKNPSIAYTHDNNGNGLYLNYIGVVWQEKHGTKYKIKGKMFTQFSTGSQLPGDGTPPSTLHTEPSDSYSVDANPGLTLAEFAFHPYLVTFERKSTSGSWSPGINWLVGQVVDQGSYVAGPFGDVEGEGVISGTNASSLHAQSSLVSSGQYEMGVNVIRQQGTGSSGKIYAHYISLIDLGSLNNTGSINWDVYQYDHNNGNTISYTGYSWWPSLVTLGNDNGNFSACWIEYTDMVYYYLGNPTSRYYYGGYYDAESCSINRGSGSNENDGYAVWSQTLSGSSWDNMSILFDEGIPQSSKIRTLSTSGKYIQLGNNVTGGTGNMYASAFKPTGSPYYTFQISSSMGPAPKQVEQEVVEHRGFILNVGETAFKYRFGGLEVDGQYIRFTEASDTADYGKLETLNKALLTEPFEVKDHSQIVFTEQPGFADSAAAARALGKDDYLRYTVELIDEATGQKAGTLREGNVSSSPRSKGLRAFAVNPAGLAGKTVRAKITVETNLVKLKEATPLPENFPVEIREAREGFRHSNLVLTKYYRKAGEGEVMDKSILEEISTIEESPKTFYLGQNYPNPFNPTTQIEYQIPNAGLVQLEVFDILGRKVQTLVNETQEVGTYTVTFDASALASGVYLYRLTSGSFVASKKLFLIK